MSGPKLAAGVAVTLALAATQVAGADAPRRPLGALQVGGELGLSGGGPRQRFGGAATAYVGQRLGVRVAVARLTLDPLADRGVLMAGVAYRAAAARPRLDLVVHAGAGVAWPRAPALGAGVTTYLWPTRWPFAVTLDLAATVVVDGAVDTRTEVAVGAGVALAR